jgi:DNA-binding Lrp family transcriptional regulator
MRAYVLIETEMGCTAAVARELPSLTFAGVTLTSSDVVTGPYDLIALVESKDLDALAQFVGTGIQGIEGVQRTVTCVA